MRAVAYIRVSSASQVDGHSLDAQERLFRELCKNRKWEPVSVYHEEGRSAHVEAIARAIVKNPPLILADEPTGNLDSHSGAEIISILTSLHAEQGVTLVVITHDANIANHCQRIIHLKDGQVEREERV